MRPSHPELDDFRPGSGGRVRTLLSLLVAWAVTAPPPAPAADGCADHFPILRSIAAQSTQREPVEVAYKAAAELGRELAIERALWQDEAARQAERLAEAPAGGAAGLERLATADGEARQRLAAVEAALAAGDALPFEAVKALTTCPAERGLPAAEPISARVAPAGAALLERRRPRHAEEPPEHYAAPPSEALRRASQAAPPERAFGRKVLFERPDPIADKVDELGNDPVALYNFVLNEIRPTSYFGTAKGPAAVLRSGEGNDADQAALLAALYRTAGFPARVAWGVMEIPVESLFEHFGATDFSHLERILTQAGIPWQPILFGGLPRAYQLERVWCELWLPYANYRGVVLDDTGFTWLALDPYMKSMEPPLPAGILDAMAFDAGTFVGDYLAGTSCTAPPTDPGACPLPSELLAQQVDAFLAGSGDYATASLPRAILAQEEAILPTGMVGVVQSVSGFGIELPEELQHRLHLVARDGQQVLFDATVPAAQLAGREAVLWFIPATEQDEAILEAYGGNLWLAPPYLVNARLELRAENEAVATGAVAIGMGRPFELEITLETPGGNSLSFTNDELAGVPIGIALAPGLQGYEPPFGDPSNTLELLSKLAGDYLDAAARFQQQAASLDALEQAHPFPSLAIVGSVVEPQGSVGLVERLHWQGAYVDADVFGARAVGSPEASRRWLELVQLEASAGERRLFEDYGMASVSADLALVLALDRGTPVLSIDGANLDAVLPTLPHDNAVLAEIEGWVLAGGEALVPAGPLDFIEWSGIGYRLVDPGTGDARYQLAGSLSGGMIAVPFFEVVAGVRLPLAHPSDKNDNLVGAEAVGVRIYDGNLQIATVGHELNNDPGSISLKVQAFDIDGDPVQNAEVTFDVVAGGGSFDGLSSVSVTTGPGGLAETHFTLGHKTDESPYYLLFPDDKYLTRVGLNLVSAEVNNVFMNELFFEFGTPDQVAGALVPQNRHQTAWPHLILINPFSVTPVDQHQNPVSNWEVRYELPDGASQNEDKGPFLLGREDREHCRPGVALAASECSGGSGQKIELSDIEGAWAYLIAGEEPSYSVGAYVETPDGSSLLVVFTVEVLTDLVPTGAEVGGPVVVVSGRGQPRSADGTESIEAYRPDDVALPLQVSLHAIQRDYDVVPCGTGHCTVPLDTYTTRRLGTDIPNPGCLVQSQSPCLQQFEEEKAEVTFSPDWLPIATTVADPVNGYYAYHPIMPSLPGRYSIRATPTACVAVPKRQQGKVTPCGNDAELELLEVSDQGWFTDSVLWAVEGRILEPPPLVLLGHDNVHETETVFNYELLPEDYPALSTTVYFKEDGAIPVFATSEGRGSGQAILPRGKFFTNPAGVHEAQVAVNVGWVWSPGDDETVSLTVESDPIEFPVAQSDIDIKQAKSADASETEVAEEKERSEGLRLLENDDDDDETHTDDNSDTTITGNAAQQTKDKEDMATLILRRLNPSLGTGKAFIKKLSGAGNVRFFRRSDNSLILTTSGTASSTTAAQATDLFNFLKAGDETYLVEGVDPGELILALELDINGQVLIDEIKVSVFDIAVIDSMSAEVDHVQVARWDMAYDATGAIRNRAAPNNFIDDDPERFTIRVTDPSRDTNASAKEMIHVKIGSVRGSGSADDDLTEIDLEETGNNTGIFESRTQLLMSPDLPVADNPDDDFPAHNGLIVTVADDVKNDRTHRAEIDGMVRLEYQPDAVTRVMEDVPVCDRDPEERRVLNMRITVFNEPFLDIGYDDDGDPATPDIGVYDGVFNFDDADGNGIHDPNEASEPFLDLSSGAVIHNRGDVPGAGSRGAVVNQARIDGVVSRANIAWAQACIKFTQVGATVKRDAPVDAIGVNILSDGSLDLPGDAQVVFNTFSAGMTFDQLEVYFAAPIPGFEAYAFPPIQRIFAHGELSFVFLEPNLDLNTRDLAHELAHILTNKLDFSNPHRWIFFPTLSLLRDNTVETYRRITHATAIDARTPRPPGNLVAVGNRLLMMP